MDELISRQATIRTLDGERFDEAFCNEYEAGYNDGIDFAVNTLSVLPSAQPESKWIPVSERLPEIDMSHPHHEHYLVQYDSGGMDVASWSNVNRFWTNHVTDPYWNCVQFAEVVAWMPLPEPYRERREDG